MAAEHPEEHSGHSSSGHKAEAAGKGKGGFLQKYKWWLLAGGVALVIYIWYVMRQNAQSSSATGSSTAADSGTSEAAQLAAQGIDPSTMVPYADEYGGGYSSGGGSEGGGWSGSGGGGGTTSTTTTNNYYGNSGSGTSSNSGTGGTAPTGPLSISAHSNKLDIGNIGTLADVFVYNSKNQLVDSAIHTTNGSFSATKGIAPGQSYYIKVLSGGKTTTRRVKA
jgi:hypothetical protein